MRQEWCYHQALNGEMKKFPKCCPNVPNLKKLDLRTHSAIPASSPSVALGKVFPSPDPIAFPSAAWIFDSIQHIYWGSTVCRHWGHHRTQHQHGPCGVFNQFGVSAMAQMITCRIINYHCDKNTMLAKNRTEDSNTGLTTCSLFHMH